MQLWKFMIIFFFSIPPFPLNECFTLNPCYTALLRQNRYNPPLFPSPIKNQNFQVPPTKWLTFNPCYVASTVAPSFCVTPDAASDPASRGICSGTSIKLQSSPDESSMFWWWSDLMLSNASSNLQGDKTVWNWVISYNLNICGKHLPFPLSYKNTKTTFGPFWRKFKPPHKQHDCHCFIFWDDFQLFIDTCMWWMLTNCYFDNRENTLTPNWAPCKEKKYSE